MKKYDRESNTRIWERTPKLLCAILWRCSLGCLVVTLTSWGLRSSGLPCSWILLIRLLDFSLAPEKQVPGQSRALV